MEPAPWFPLNHPSYEGVNSPKGLQKPARKVAQPATLLEYIAAQRYFAGLQDFAGLLGRVQGQ